MGEIVVSVNIFQEMALFQIPHARGRPARVQCVGCLLYTSVTPSATVLQEGDTYDMAGVRVRILDENGSPAVYAQLPRTCAGTGAAALVGPAAATAEGGMGGTYLRTVGQTGTARCV